MYELIVLGLVPGTQMQITFGLWLVVATSFAGVIMLWQIVRSQALRRAIVSVVFNRTVHQVQMLESEQLHA